MRVPSISALLEVHRSGSAGGLSGAHVRNKRELIRSKIRWTATLFLLLLFAALLSDCNLPTHALTPALVAPDARPSIVQAETAQAGILKAVAPTACTPPLVNWDNRNPFCANRGRA